MATYDPNKLRAVAIEAQAAIVAHYADVLPLFQAVTSWTVHCTNTALPTPFEVKVVLDGYSALKLSGLELKTWIADVKQALSGDTLATMPACGPAPDTGGILFPTPGLTIAHTGLTIPADDGLIIHAGLNIPQTGIMIPS